MVLETTKETMTSIDSHPCPSDEQRRGESFVIAVSTRCLCRRHLRWHSLVLDKYVHEDIQCLHRQGGGVTYLVLNTRRLKRPSDVRNMSCSIVCNYFKVCPTFSLSRFAFVCSPGRDGLVVRYANECISSCRMTDK